MNHIMTFKSLWLSLQLPLTNNCPFAFANLSSPVVDYFNQKTTLVVSDVNTFFTLSHPLDQGLCNI